MFEVRLSDEGEVLIRGPVVIRGYRNGPDKTADAIDADGWLHSGDVGVFDDEGYLRIVDRIKELIISAAGKNMSPANIEAVARTSGGLIGPVCCIGDGRPYNTALITLDSDARSTCSPPSAGSTAFSPTSSRRTSWSEMSPSAVQRANTRLARVEQIKRFRDHPRGLAA